jgi:hypothetical protein
MTTEFTETAPAVQLHRTGGYPLLTTEQKVAICAHADNGLTSPEIKEVMGLDYVQQVAGVLAARTNARRRAAARGDEEDDEIEPVDPAVLAALVDTSDVLRIGSGSGVVYAYGYRGLANALKIGRSDGPSEQRIAQQINVATPGKPVLVLEIRTDDCRKLERALHPVLDLRGRKIGGGGAEWFAVTRDEVVALQEGLAR